jgi:hypothetical protein
MAKNWLWLLALILSPIVWSAIISEVRINGPAAATRHFSMVASPTRKNSNSHPAFGSVSNPERSPASRLN